ncbi:lysylphosphatidylglycerol synthase domain-containing protein [Azohydromonas lata]|uniref:lysylphosphatidylglycerol synthase domain-containing protein n=1 Tax=Azohydromonas lata TaxID=45677 RepID=UPI0008364DF0|nr:lysylphosphatidylglycerol synthase domain-containing protein [Azohydromonas lata]
MATSRSVHLYILALLGLTSAWLWWRFPAIAELRHQAHMAGLLAVAAIYLCAHLLRMVRLGLLTLDERERVFDLVTAHALTAFPSSFLPFKLGEALRLAAFFKAFGGRRKALAVWLAERFSDMVVIAGFILTLYLLNVGVPKPMRIVFMIFVLVSMLGLLGLFAVAKVCVYLSRHLVLSSHSARGLRVLRINHALRKLELEIYKSVEGRLSGLFLISVLIWGFEILALSLFISQFSIGEPDFSSLFVAGLVASLPGGHAGEAGAFGLYQSLVLVALSLCFMVFGGIGLRLGIVKSK